ncbi:MAG: glycoside hydrolase family 19 protein [Vampirovibrionia bacterium]
MKEIVPKVSLYRKIKQDKYIDEISDDLNDILNKYEINTKLRISHFFGQITHECDGFCTLEEYASGVAYENRKDLGNTNPGDGKRYKGRGYIQITGKANYELYGRLLGLDLINNPELLLVPKNGLLVSCEYWKQHDLNKYADDDDITKITKKINGGYNGLDYRKQYFNKSKTICDILDGTTNAKLSIGSKGYFIEYIQLRLKEKGYAIYIDGDFGGQTESVLKQYQQENGFIINGTIDRTIFKSFF